MRTAPVVGTAALLLAGCFGWGFLHDQPLDGPWRLVAVDTREDMALCRRLAQSACVGDMLHGPTVFAAGIDQRYVVYARHPRAFPDAPQRDVTEFHYVIRTPGDDRPAGLKAENIRGPFDEAAFEAERRRLELPAFSILFEDLR